MSLSESTISQLQSLKDAGDMASAESYYNILAANGHDYGNLAVQAATDTGFWGKYANNFMELKAQEYGIVIDRDKIMQELMQADFAARENNRWEPIPAKAIREYHHDVFDVNDLPKGAWTGTMLDDRAGPGAWCIRCNDIERSGQDWKDALANLGSNMVHDSLGLGGYGTNSEVYDFLTDALGDGVLSQTLSEHLVDITDLKLWQIPSVQ